MTAGIRIVASALLSAVSACASAPQATPTAARAAESGGKMSLNAALDENRKVTLLDDESGEPKLVCKRVVVTGDRFVRKTCATPKEWAQKKQDSRDELDGIQRRMDAKCSSSSSAC